jgi:Fur family transcriptional regulator, ferric uptake regulator
MDTWPELALERLRAGSGRSGGARRLVVDFVSRQDCCLSVQEIHERVRAEGARVGIASVYRAVQGLVEAGLAQRIDLGDGIARFERADPKGDHHHHLVCEDCGKVEAFEDAGLEADLERVAGARGYAIAAHDVVVRGACEACRG